jgi:hypothetical protein
MEQRKQVLLAAVAAAAAMLWAQSARDPYRQAYRDWQQIDPGLERDAAKAVSTVPDRTGRSAQGSAIYTRALSEYLHLVADQAAQNVLWLNDSAAPPAAALAPAENLQSVVAASDAVLGRTIQAFARDPDRGIQLLRQALEREREALSSVRTAIEERQKASADRERAFAEADAARTSALAQYEGLAAGFSEIAKVVDQEPQLWANYYRELAEGVKIALAPPPPAPAEASGSVPVARNPAAAVESPALVPLVRYVGEWSYPGRGGLFHGAQPESVQLIVTGENGRAIGRLGARFTLPAGTTGDPTVSFTFTGDFRPGRIQRFPLETVQGLKGVVELIPGPAFNLLEVNFSTDAAPARVTRGNFVLLKK